MPLKTIQFYGYLGVLPFILFTIAPWLSSDFSEISLKAISFYGGVIYHSDPTMARPPLADALEENGHRVHTPENGISGILD